MIDWLDNLDKQLFLWLNSHHNAFFDQFMWFVSGKFSWSPLYLLFIIAIFVYYKKQGFWILFTIILLITITDQFTSGLLKPLVGRLRPCHDPVISDMVHNVKRCGGQFSFVSGHSANSFALATFSYMLFKNRFTWIWLAFIWAALVAYSRIYLGVHYPGDIIVGGIIGSCFAYLMYLLLVKVNPNIKTEKIIKD